MSAHPVKRRARPVKRFFSGLSDDDIDRVFEEIEHAGNPDQSVDGSQNQSGLGTATSPSQHERTPRRSD